MEVCGDAVEGDGDLVAAEGEVLVVEGLVDVADEVDEEHEGLVYFGGAEGGAADAGGLGWLGQQGFWEMVRCSSPGFLT